VAVGEPSVMGRSVGGGGGGGGGWGAGSLVGESVGRGAGSGVGSSVDSGEGIVLRREAVVDRLLVPGQVQARVIQVPGYSVLSACLPTVQYY